MKKLNRRYGAKTVAQYSICDGPKRCWDAYKTTHGPPALLMMQEKNNSCFRVKNRKIILETTKAIKPHEEIYADYGSDYWPRSYYKKKQVKFFSKKKINFLFVFSKKNG